MAHRTFNPGLLAVLTVLLLGPLTGPVGAQAIGTVNFDNRSFQINFELTLWFTHPRMIDNVESMLETDFQNSRLTWPDAFQSRSYVFRVLAQGARLLSPIL